MKILKIFGIVVGIHVFALILIFANPGCSSTTKPAPAAADTVAATDNAPSPAPMITVPPGGGGGADQLAGTPVTPAAGSDLTAAGTDATSGVRFSPTRPNTPAASAVLRGDVENVTPATTYTVKKGDSLWSLQKKFHISIKELTAANNLRSNAAIRPGQKLIIPSNAPAGSKAATAKGTAAAGATVATKAASSPSTRPTSQEFKYKVKPGETLGGIAHKFGVSVAELGAQNNISDPMKLRAGTELTIPGWQPTSGSSSGSKGTASHERRNRERASQPAAAPEPAAPETTPAPATTEQQTQVPNLLEPSPAQPAPADSTPSTSVPVIDIGGQDSSSSSSTSTPSQ